MNHSSEYYWPNQFLVLHFGLSSFEKREFLRFDHHLIHIKTERKGIFCFVKISTTAYYQLPTTVTLANVQCSPMSSLTTVLKHIFRFISSRNEAIYFVIGTRKHLESSQWSRITNAYMYTYICINLDWISSIAIVIVPFGLR